TVEHGRNVGMPAIVPTLHRLGDALWVGFQGKLRHAFSPDCPPSALKMRGAKAPLPSRLKATEISLTCQKYFPRLTRYLPAEASRELSRLVKSRSVLQSESRHRTNIFRCLSFRALKGRQTAR